jgi:hypothetical protein
VAPLLEKGAAASLGNVYEPYLELTPHLDIFNDRLLHGFTFAESAYMATRTLSWMTVAVGDPLYRPYAAWLQVDAKPGGKTTDEWKMYRDFAPIHNQPAPNGARFESPGRGTDSMRIGRPGFGHRKKSESSNGAKFSRRSSDLAFIGISPLQGFDFFRSATQG